MIERSIKLLKMMLIYVNVKSPPKKKVTGSKKYIKKYRLVPEQSFGCFGKACLNQFISTECVGKLCPSGKLCANRRFQLQHYSEVFPKRTDDRVRISIYNIHRVGDYLLGSCFRKEPLLCNIWVKFTQLTQIMVFLN